MQTNYFNFAPNVSNTKDRLPGKKNDPHNCVGDTKKFIIECIVSTGSSATWLFRSLNNCLSSVR